MAHTENKPSMSIFSDNFSWSTPPAFVTLGEQSIARTLALGEMRAQCVPMECLQPGLHTPEGFELFTRMYTESPRSTSSSSQDETVNPSPATTPSPSSPPSGPPANIPAPTGRSLTRLFPRIPEGVLQAVARHDFRPTDLSKLEPTDFPRNARTGTVFEFDPDTRSFTVREPSAEDYPSFHSLFAPLTTYFHILTMSAASGGDVAAVTQVASGAYAYLAQLEQFNDVFKWTAVRAYHIEFHHKRRGCMMRGDYSGWDAIDAQLYVKHLIGRERRAGTHGRRRRQHVRGGVPV
ncbi:hypothetical protein C2E23DRAFT_4097 [Lenzites betulinus]|nr:hypothetical protein C2E23DRAFT_4097 [Lenzites betulinus]